LSTISNFQLVIGRGPFGPSQSSATLTSPAGPSSATGVRNESRELADLLATRTPRELVLATRVLRTLFDELDAIPVEEPEDFAEESES
jgi:hypothetical protein